MEDKIKSQIDGNFTGFNADELFKLANGQIWQQAEYRYLHHYAYRPEVIIYQENGSYLMKVDGIEEPIPVKQLK